MLEKLSMIRSSEPGVPRALDRFHAVPKIPHSCHSIRRARIGVRIRLILWLSTIASVS